MENAVGLWVRNMGIYKLLMERAARLSFQYRYAMSTP